MVFIYCIEDVNGLKYIGSTKNLNRRLSQHRETKNQCSSRELDLQNSKIYPLEECTEENRKVKEQYWIDNTECVNIQNTVFDKKEYDKQWEKTEQRTNSKKEYYKKNKQLYEQRYFNNKDKINQRKINNRKFQLSWGGDSRFHNNLLKIDVNLFL